MRFLRATAAALSMCAACVVQAQAPAPTAPRDLDRIAAVVNSDVITLRELAVRVGFVERQLRGQRIEPPPREVLERQVLERMILDRLQAQRAREQGLRIDDAALDRALSSIAEQNRVSVSTMRQRIEADGMPFSRFREDVRQDMLLGRLREREVESRIQVSEADVDAFLAEQAAAGPASTEVLVAQILLRVPEGASAEQIEGQRRRGEELLRQLGRGGDFARLAASFSDAPEAMSGGSLGWRTVDRLPELFAQAITSLKPGETTQLLRSPNGFHILRLVERRGIGNPALAAARQPVQQTRVRHILLRITEQAPEGEVTRRLAELRERVASGRADFADLARQFSADGSAGRGGDLGWIYPGDTVPEFEQAMNALAPGAISTPVRTAFGLHLIQVLERRVDEASPERLRAAARQALRERRLDETLQEWLRQLRDSAYVEYRLENS